MKAMKWLSRKLMTKISQPKINQILSLIKKSESIEEQQYALKWLMTNVLEKIPGLSVTEENGSIKSRKNEIKIVCWNEQHPDGLYFFPSILAVGAINWLDPVSSNHIKWFVGNMKKMGLSCGILFAVGKLTEDDVERSDTRDLISLALGDEREVVILDGSDLEKLTSSERLVALIKEKLCELAVV